MARLTFEKLWVDGRWLSDATLELDDYGKCVPATRAPAEAREPSEYVAGLTLPGLASVHCHAFQRNLPAWTQRGGGKGDDFRTWRNLMYAAAGNLDPEDLEAIDDDGAWRGQPSENWLGALVFGYGEPKAQHVIAGGRRLIRDGVHENEVEIELAYRAALSRLKPTLIEAQSPSKQDGDHPW